MLSRTLLVFIALFLSAEVASSQESLTWSGRWNNRKFGTSGPLKCVARETTPGKWSATFTGTFQGDPFEYKADFDAKSSNQGLQLAGQYKIRGHQYQWTGAMTASQLRGQYRNNVGYNGEFILSGKNSPLKSMRQTSRTKRTSEPRETPPAYTAPMNVEWDPVIKDGERMLFLGNSYMANEGGVHNYFARALEKKQYSITTDKLIAYGKPLKAMLHPTAASKISGEFDSVVITSGEIGVMKQFDERIKREGKTTIVFMTWDGKHVGNNATKSQYSASTRRTVRQMRQMEKETGATIIPSAVVFHDLTIRPPEGMPRIDYLWKERNIHQNELGTLVNAWMMYAILMADSPVGLNFDMSPFVVGQKIQSDAGIRLTRDLRLELQQRVWQVAQAWRSGRCHLE